MLKLKATGEGLETGGEGWGALITWVELWEGSVRAAWKTPPPPVHSPRRGRN